MKPKRLPLIAPGSALPASDTLARILARDRSRSGRPDPAGANETQEGTNAAAEQEGMDAAAESVALPADLTGLTSSRADFSQADTQADTQADAPTQEMPPALRTITLRLPEDLNDWLDDYAHAHRKAGVRKQDLIARAVELLRAQLEDGRSENSSDLA